VRVSIILPIEFSFSYSALDKDSAKAIAPRKPENHIRNLKFGLILVLVLYSFTTALMISIFT